MANLLNKRDFGSLRGKSPAAVTKWLKAGMPVRPDGMIDVDQATAWLDDRAKLVSARIPVTPPAGAASTPSGDAHLRLLEAKNRKEEATARLTEIKAGRVEGELGKLSEFRLEAQRASERERESIMDSGRGWAVAISGRYGLDLGDVQHYLLGLVREHCRRRAAECRAEADRLEALA